MRFAAPNVIPGLFVLVAIGVALLWSERERRRALARFADPALQQALLQRLDEKRRRVKSYLVFFAAALMVAALLRPQWGFHWQEVKRRGLDIVVALDVSKSMLTQDIRPSRLERSKLALRDFVRSLKGDRIGLVVFSGTAFLECPLTLDYGGFLLTLDDVTTSTIPRGGTSLESALRETMRAYASGVQKYKVVIVITDGEELEGDALRAAEEARQQGVTVYCIGVGTKEGDLILLSTNGSQSYLKDSQGNVVKSRLNEQLLEKIAISTGGSYVRATTTEFGLELLYRQRLSQLEKSDFQTKMNRRYHERFQIPLTLALLLLIAEAVITDRK